MLRSLEVQLTSEEHGRNEQILDVLTGNGERDKMRQDAAHVAEASKYGGYFITTDGRILKKKDELERICSAIIVKPTDFLGVLAKYEASGAGPGAPGA
jgi:hypothetical protein